MRKNNSKSNVIHVAGNKVVSGTKTPVLPSYVQGAQNQIVQVSNSSPIATYVNATTTVPAFTEIVTENNIGEILLKAISKMPSSSLAELRFRVEMIGLDKETREEYETLLKLYDYDYERTLYEVITTERDKALMKKLKGED